MYLPIYVIIVLNTHDKDDRKIVFGRENVQSHSVLTNWKTQNDHFKNKKQEALEWLEISIHKLSNAG